MAVVAGGKWWQWPKKRTDTRVADALRVLQQFWGGAGHVNAVQVATALRALKPAELELVRAWVPAGNPGSTTAMRCARAREIVSGVLQEKLGRM